MNKKCSKCLEIKEFILFDKNSSTKDGLQHHCKICRKKYRDDNKNLLKESNSNYYNSNKEKCLNRNKVWAINNRESSNNIKYKYYKNNREKYASNKRNRYLNDDLFSIKERLKSRTCYIFKKNGYKKNTKTEILLGISYIEIVKYLENLFLENMSWENKYKWHIDHIIPLDSAKTEDELIKLCHYTNLQPLWAVDNLKKSNKII